jgi:pimeloyl-ACP methyl ester carboxylesterase
MEGQGSDQRPTGVDTKTYELRFTVPDGLMPDSQFDGRPASLHVHRVYPVYENGTSPPEKRAAVLIHGRTVPGPVAFDLRYPAPGGGDLSVRYELALEGIDTFAPSLLGHGKSTRFNKGLDDPGNASLRPYLPDGTSCPYPEKCDRTLIPSINPLDQQRTMLFNNPLPRKRRAHSSKYRFARTDVWVRDIDQVIAFAIEEAKPTDGKVALVGYSLGGQQVGRTLYADNPNELLENRDEVIEKVSRVVFLNSLFGGPTEEPPGTDRPTFPLTLNDRSGSNVLWRMPTERVEREAACPGHIIPGTQEEVWKQTMEHDTVGRRWGGNNPHDTDGLNRADVLRLRLEPRSRGAAEHTHARHAGSQGHDRANRAGAGAAIYEALYEALPASTTNKVLVQVDCASHALLWEGCAGERCTPLSGTPYGGTPGAPWEGPHATFKAALIEWVKYGKFNGQENGSSSSTRVAWHGGQRAEIESCRRPLQARAAA